MRIILYVLYIMLSKTLIIVESAGKITKIQNYLGDDYIVTASCGHVLDIDPSCIGIDFDNDFKPSYIVKSDKQHIIDKLLLLCKKCKSVILASDDDSEGAFIAWSLGKLLQLKNPLRMIFNDITQKSIDYAINNLQPIDKYKVECQKTRRILDRIIGYSISPLVSRSMSLKNLSAGRVQSVVVRLIYDNEMEITSFYNSTEQFYFKITSMFGKIPKSTLHIYDGVIDDEINYNKYILAKTETKKKAIKLMKLLQDSIFTISHTVIKEKYQNPHPPFTTSTLQQEAYKKYGFNAKYTMSLAQKLYENGYITYIRTDSVRLSDESLENIKEYIIDTLGTEYYKLTKYKVSKNAQGAHEAIRPTNVSTFKIKNSTKDEIDLYTLIWKRAIASQMTPAKYDIAYVYISIDNLQSYCFVSHLQKLSFDGFLKIYNIINIEKEHQCVTNFDIIQCDNDDSAKTFNIPKIGQTLLMCDVTSIQEFKTPPTRYNESMLVNKLDPSNLNIGRPSTYATIIDKIVSTGYVVKKNIDGIKKQAVVLTIENDEIYESIHQITFGNEINKFVITDLGTNVTKFLLSTFPEIMEYSFTASMENNLDIIETGEKTRLELLTSFYTDFKSLIDNTKMLVINISAGYPKLIGTLFDKQINLMSGKFGPYIKYGEMNIKIPKDLLANINNITIDDIVPLLDSNPKQNLCHFKQGKNEYTVLDGKFGKYINIKTNNKFIKNVKLPPDIIIDELTCNIIKNIVKCTKTKEKTKKTYAK